MSDGPDSYGALLDRARGGDRSALARLAALYEPRLRIVARVLLGPALRPHLDSLDLVQSVHKSLMVGLRADKYDISTPEQMLALALTMARRKAARHWRRHQRQKRLDGASDNGPSLVDCLASLSGPRGDPAAQALLKDQIDHLCRDLKDADRRMLQMRAEGYTTEEIANELGIHPIALRVRLTRLRQKLKETGVDDDWL